MNNSAKCRENASMLANPQTFASYTSFHWLDWKYGTGKFRKVNFRQGR